MLRSEKPSLREDEPGGGTALTGGESAHDGGQKAINPLPFKVVGGFRGVVIGRLSGIVGAWGSVRDF